MSGLIRPRFPGCRTRGGWLLGKRLCLVSGWSLVLVLVARLFRVLLALVLVAATTALTFGLLAALTPALALASRSASHTLSAEGLDIVRSTRTTRHTGTGSAKSLRLALAAAILIILVAVALLELVGATLTPGPPGPNSFGLPRSPPRSLLSRLFCLN
jgi:hypothetical protein